MNSNTALSAFSVFMGAGIGALARWQLGLWLNSKASIPLGTLAANWLGGLLVGLLAGYFSTHPDLAPQWRLFWVTGLLGGLTTFSTFSAESVGFLQRGEWLHLLAHSGLHTLGSIALAALGFWLIAQQR